MATDPSMQVIVDVGIDTREPVDLRVRRSVLKVPIFNGIEFAAVLTKSDATTFINPLPAGVGLGMQKYPALQFAHAHPKSQTEFFCAGVG
jgi:hypothetical protein